MRKQRTIRANIEFSGIGIHSGHPSRIIIKPAPEDTGIVFIMKHGEVSRTIPFTPNHISDTTNNISASNGLAVVKTVEHLTAALYAYHVDNCFIECSSSEIPIMDGSAADFAADIQKTGTVDQNKDRQEYRIIHPIWVTFEDKYIVALPYEGFKLSYTISFPNSPIGTQTYMMDVGTEAFRKNLSQARTFGFVEDLEHHQKNGLSLGVNYDNVHAFSRKENKAMNGSRFDDEPVRHKMVDLLGGLALLNFDIKGFIISFKGGHKLDVMFVKKLAQQIQGVQHTAQTKRQGSDMSYYYHLADLLELTKTPS